MVLMLVYPPWMLQDKEGKPVPMGYSLIWSPPVRTVTVPAIDTRWFDINLSEEKSANTIDFGRLLLQEVIVLIIVGGLALITGSRKLKTG